MPFSNEFPFPTTNRHWHQLQRFIGRKQRGSYNRIEATPSHASNGHDNKSLASWMRVARYNNPPPPINSPPSLPMKKKWITHSAYPVNFYLLHTIKKYVMSFNHLLNKKERGRIQAKKWNRPILEICRLELSSSATTDRVRQPPLLFIAAIETSIYIFFFTPKNRMGCRWLVSSDRKPMVKIRKKRTNCQPVFWLFCCCSIHMIELKSISLSLKREWKSRASGSHDWYGVLCYHW